MTMQMDKKRILNAIYELAMNDRRLNADTAMLNASSVFIAQGKYAFRIEVKEVRRG